MAQRLRLKAAVCTGVLAASMATPAVESAFASSPTLPDVSSAPTTAGVTSASVSSILGELSTLQGVAPGGSLGPLSLSALDNSVTALNGACSAVC